MSVTRELNLRLDSGHQEIVFGSGLVRGAVEHSAWFGVLLRDRNTINSAEEQKVVRLVAVLGSLEILVLRSKSLRAKLGCPVLYEHHRRLENLGQTLRLKQ